MIMLKELINTTQAMYICVHMFKNNNIITFFTSLTHFLEQSKIMLLNILGIVIQYT